MTGISGRRANLVLVDDLYDPYPHLLSWPTPPELGKMATCSFALSTSLFHKDQKRDRA